MKTKPTKTKTRTRPTLDTPLGAFGVGDPIVVRAIPYHYIGRVVALGAHAVTLEDACWLADSARWGSDFLLHGKVSEAEPYAGPVSIRYEVIADVTGWPHKLPLSQI